MRNCLRVGVFVGEVFRVGRLDFRVGGDFGRRRVRIRVEVGFVVVINDRVRIFLFVFYVVRRFCLFVVCLRISNVVDRVAVFELFGLRFFIGNKERDNSVLV